MIDVSTKISKKLWKTVEWPTLWAQSLIITLLKKGNLQLCQMPSFTYPIQHFSRKDHV